MAVERRPVKGEPVRGGCEGCPAAGACGSCPFRSPLIVRGESGSGEKLVFNGGIKELLSLPKLPDFIDFSARQGGGEPLIRISKETQTCSDCKKSLSSCSCSHSDRT